MPNKLICQPHNRYAPDNGSVTLLDPIHTRPTPSFTDVELEQVIGRCDVRVTGSEIERERARTRYTVVILPNDGSPLFRNIRDINRRKWPASQLKEGHALLLPLLTEYALQVTACRIDGTPLSSPLVSPGTGEIQYPTIVRRPEELSPQNIQKQPPRSTIPPTRGRRAFQARPTVPTKFAYHRRESCQECFLLVHPN